MTDQDSRKQDKGKSFELRFYSGYKGEERPVAVVIGDREFKIEKILKRKRVLDSDTGKTWEEFVCRMEGEAVRIRVYPSGEFELIF